MGRGKLLAIGAYCWYSTLFLMIGVLICVHEAIRVRAGQGDSWGAALMIMVLCPISVAGGIVGALKVYHAGSDTPKSKGVRER